MKKDDGSLHARLRLATRNGKLVSNGYKSGRRRWRDTPVTDSIASTLSAGTTPRANQLDTVLCRPTPKRRAKALCPPTALHASSIAFLDMARINAQPDNGVNAMSQGSVGRWYHGEGFPEMDTCIELAERGRVCVDWLLTGRLPKYPISRDSAMREIFETCQALDDDGRTAVLRAARGELLQKQAADIAEAKTRQKRA